MTMSKGFKLFHTLFLVLHCCVKVGATFHDVTGIFGHRFNHRFSFLHAFGSGGVSMLSNTGGSSALSVVDIESPAQAPTPEIARVGIETDPTKNINDLMAFISKDHDIHWKSGGNIALSHGGVVSSDGKIVVKSNSNIAVSHGIEASMSRNNKASFGLEIEKNNVATLGFKAPTRKVHVGISHGANFSLKKRGNIVSNGGRIGLKNNANVVASHGFAIEGTM